MLPICTARKEQNVTVNQHGSFAGKVAFVTGAAMVKDGGQNGIASVVASRNAGAAHATVAVAFIANANR